MRRRIARALYWVLPNLASFDVRAQVVHGQPVSAGYIALMTGYGALYIAALIVARDSGLLEKGLQVSVVGHLAWRALAGAIVAAVLIGAAASLQAVREVRYPEPPPTKESLYLTSGTAARRLSIGYSALAADLYWIRAIQYYGGDAASARSGRRRSRPRNASAEPDFDLLYPLLDLTTTLDPRFNIAYRFGSIFLAEPPPGGAGRPDLAIALLEKGLRERPDKWEYMQDIGFVHYWWRQRLSGRRRVVRQGEPGAWRAVVPAIAGGRHARRRRRSAIVARHVDGDSGIGGERLAARTTPNADFSNSTRQISIDALQQAVDAAAPRTGKLTNWQDLIRAGVVRGVPLDPAGVPLGIDDGIARAPRGHVAAVPAAGRTASAADPPSPNGHRISHSSSPRRSAR